MSEIRVNDIIAQGGTSAPTLVYGAQLPTGYGITGAGGVNISGVVTATRFSGDGSTLTGVAATLNVRTNSLVSSGIVSVTNTTESTTSSTGALIVSGGLGVAGNISCAGTITYEDVTNVDSLGIVTARTGVRVTAGGVVVTAGVATFSAPVLVNSTLTGSEGLHVSAGVATFAGTSTFAQKSTFNGTLEATEGLNVTAGVATFAGNQTVAGTSSFAQKATVNATLNATEGIDITAGILTAAAGSNFSGGELNIGTGVTVGASGVSTFSSGVHLRGGGLLREKVNIVAGKASDTTDINLDYGSVWHFTTVETANFVPNIMSNVGINTSMEIGDTIVVSVATSCAAVSWAATITVDGAAVSEQDWAGGSAPTEGGAAGSHDLYVHNIIKTAANTYTVLSNVTNFAS